MCQNSEPRIWHPNLFPNPTRTFSFPRDVVLQEGVLRTGKHQVRWPESGLCWPWSGDLGARSETRIPGRRLHYSLIFLYPALPSSYFSFQRGPQSTWKVLTDAYCVHVCRASNMYIHWPARLPFRKLETDVSAKLITGLLYLCLEFKELPSSGFK